MPKLIGRDVSLWARGKKELKPGRYSDGRNLYLMIEGPRAGRWLYIYKDGSKTPSGYPRSVEISIGSCTGAKSAVSYDIEEARAKAAEISACLKRGEDPRIAQVASMPLPTLGELLGQYLDEFSSEWKEGSGTEKQWRSQLGLHCKGLLGTQVDRIGDREVFETLKPIWGQTIGGTQRQRLETLLDYAKVTVKRDYRQVIFPEGNPARWNGHMEFMLKKAVQKGGTLQDPRHMASLDFSETPGFVLLLRAMGTTPANVLLFTILTAVRVNEAAGARWSEIDLDAGRWTIPAERMKAGVLHLVPLSRQAVELLRELPRNGEFVFPAAKDPSKAMDSKLINELIWRMEGGAFKGRVTTHGFRSTFRTWANKQTRPDGSQLFDHQDMEWCLAHATQKNEQGKANRVQAAYLRDTEVERRAVIMQRWADFATGSNVVQLRGKAVA